MAVSRLSGPYKSEGVEDGTAKFPFSYTVAVSQFGSSVGGTAVELIKPSGSESPGAGSA